MIRTAIASLVVVLIASVCLVQADDPTREVPWPTFRGNLGQTGVSNVKLPDKLKEKWTFTTGDSVDGTAAIAGDVVYIASLDSHVYAIDLKTGKEKWKYKAAPFDTPAAVRKDLVYIGDTDGVFHCIEAKTGKLKWKFETKSMVTSGATFAGENVLFGADNETLYCLDKDGKSVWTFKVEGGPVKATPSVVDGKTFVAGCDSVLHVIDVSNGKEIRGVELTGQVGATAAVVGEHLFVGTMTNDVQAIDWKEGKVQWTFQPKKLAQPFFASVAVTEKLVIAGSKDKKVYGLDRKSGEEVWSVTTGGRIECSPVVVGSRVYVGSLDKHLYVIDRDKGTVIQKIELDGPINGSPAVADGIVLIGTQKGTVYCFGE